MLSGIGDAAELRAVGVAPLVNLPEVGKHLVDHPLLPLQWTVNSNDTMDPVLRPGPAFDAALAQYNDNQSGRFAANGVSNHMYVDNTEFDLQHTILMTLPQVLFPPPSQLPYFGRARRPCTRPKVSSLRVGLWREHFIC